MGLGGAQVALAIWRIYNRRKSACCRDQTNVEERLDVYEYEVKF